MRYIWRFDWLLVFITAIGTRLIPFFIYGQHPLGYDTGFYRRYAAQTLESFPDAPSAGLGNDALAPRLILDIGKLLGVPPDPLIYGVLIGAFACAAVTFHYAVKKRLGGIAGLLAGLAFIFSSVQYAGYWFFLLKNYVALCFLFLAFAELEKQKKTAKKSIPLAGYAALIFLSHTTTSVIFIATLAVFFILKIGEENKKRYATPFALCVVGIALFLAISGIWQKIDWQTPGIFLDWKEYAEISLPLLLISAYTLGRIWRKAAEGPFFALLIVTGTIVVLRGPFYERVFLFLDIALIALIAESLSKMKKGLDTSGYGKKIALIAGTAMLTGWYAGNLSWTIKRYVPMVTKEEVVEMKKVDGMTEKDATILTVSDYMPWVYGFTKRKVISPGLRERIYNLEDWQRFWFKMNEEEKIEFLKIFPKPLYFFTIPGSDDNFLEAKCVKKKTDYLQRFKCD